MAFTLPDLPYAHDALAAKGMSSETMEFHHDLHHKAYVDNGNNIQTIPIYAYMGQDGHMVPVKMFDGTQYMGSSKPNAGTWVDFREVIQQSLMDQAIADGIPSENLYSHVQSQMPSYSNDSVKFIFKLI